MICEVCVDSPAYTHEFHGVEITRCVTCLRKDRLPWDALIGMAANLGISGTQNQLSRELEATTSFYRQHATEVWNEVELLNQQYDSMKGARPR